MLCRAESSIPNIIAHQNPSVEKWLNILSARSIISVLTTNKNSPNVRAVSGKVSIIKMGFTRVLRSPNIIATIKVYKNPFTCIPGSK